MSIECKTYATQGAARTGIANAEKSWTPPEYTNVGGGRHVAHEELPAQRLAEPIELVNGRWAVIAVHPSWKGEQINESDIKRAIEAAAQKGKT